VTQKIKKTLAWFAAPFSDEQPEIERSIVIALLVSVLLFGIADWLGFFGAAGTCR
jgi:hypothetical protein